MDALIGTLGIMTFIVSLVLLIVFVFMKKEKPLKVVGITTVAGAVLCIIGLVMPSSSHVSTPSHTDTTVSTSTSTTATPQPEVKKEEPKKEEPKNKPTMSKAEFDQIQNGMNYEEVTTIVGGPGEMLSETGSKGDEFYTAMYSFKGEGGLGANSILTFQGGKLLNKSQMGLK